MLQQETLDKFTSLENKELQLRDEFDGRLRKIETERALPKFNEPETTPSSNAGLPVEWRVSKSDLTEAIERSASEITEDCAMMCNRIRQDVGQKLGPIQRDLISQSGLMEAQRLSIEEWEERTRKWDEDGGFLDVKLNKVIQDVMGQINALEVEYLQIEMQ